MSKIYECCIYCVIIDLVNYRIDQKIINFSENYKNSKQITSSKSYSLISMKSRSNACFFLNQTNNNKLD